MFAGRREAGAHPPAGSTASRSPSSQPPPPRNRSRPDPRGGRTRLSLLLPVLALLLASSPAVAQEMRDVPANWPLKPAGLRIGDQFRLLFVTSKPIHAKEVEGSSEIGRYNARYGLGGPASLGTLTPYAGLGLAGDDARTWRAGARWSIAPDVSLGLEGTRNGSAGGRSGRGAITTGCGSRYPSERALSHA